MKEKVKKICINDYLRGWGDNFYREDFVTQIKITKEALTKFMGQHLWVKSKVPAWVDLIKEQSGLTIVKYDIVCDYMANDFNLVCSSTRIGSTKIILYAQAVGGMVFPDNVEPKMAKSISALIKKNIALDLLDRFPPNFDICYPNFAKASEDILVFCCPGGQCGWGAEELRVIKRQSNRLLDSMSVVFKKYGAKLKAYYFPISRNDGHIRVKVEYREEIGIKTKKFLIKEIEDLFTSLCLRILHEFF